MWAADGEQHDTYSFSAPFASGANTTETTHFLLGGYDCDNTLNLRESGDGTNASWLAQPPWLLKTGELNWHETQTHNVTPATVDMPTTWEGHMTFVAPADYPPGTPVIFTFDGVDYARDTGVPLDLSHVTFLGQEPIAYSGSSVSYLTTMSGGESYTLDCGSFGWPGGYSKTSTIAVDPSINYTLTWIESANWFKFDSFGNQKITVSVAPNPFIFCVGTNAETFVASGALGTFTYSWTSSGQILSTSGGRSETAVVVFASASSNASVTAKVTTPVGAISAMATGIVNDIWIDHMTFATTPADTNRTTIGVGEEVTLTLRQGCSGDITWELSGPGTISATNNFNPITFTAGGQASSPTVTARQNGLSRTVSFDVKEPTWYDHADFLPTGDPAFSAGTAGASMRLYVTMAPTSVSFYRVQMGELTNAASSITGYFTNFPQDALAHTTAGHFWGMTESNQWVDSCSGGGFLPPWSNGSFNWVIPWRWYVPGYSTNMMSPWAQVFTIDAEGRVTIAKFGRAVVRTTNDVTTTYP